MWLALRSAVNRARRGLWRLLWGRMLFGERNHGQALPGTRIAASTVIDHEERLTLADHVYIGPFNFIEASGGVTLGEGVQVTSHVSIVTHSSHRAMRLLGRRYGDWSGELPGWIAGPVVVGPYSFIGPHSLIEANTRLGRGTLVCAGSIVRGEFPDFAVLDGRPAKVVGDTRQADAALVARHPEVQSLREAWAGAGGALPPRE
jgi:acetyltransferase-like isoleucine patch superfamily enzyme